MQQKLKVGILGAGHIAQKMATTLMGMKEAELYAVAARELSRSEQFADEFHAQKAYGNYEALADDPDIDLIYIATPHSHHFGPAGCACSKGNRYCARKHSPPMPVKPKN